MMPVADRQSLSGKERLDDFVAAMSEHGDDDTMLDDEDDDLQLANVSEDQVNPGLPVDLLKQTYACSQLDALPGWHTALRKWLSSTSEGAVSLAWQLPLTD